MSPRLALVLALFVVACSPTLAPEGDDAIGALPATILDPASNPSSPARVALGRALFWDPILSGDRDVACATCHHPAFDYADGRATSLGAGGIGLGPAREPFVPEAADVTRNAPTIVDVAFNGWTRAPIAPELAPMFWDNRAQSLEAQVLGPLESPAEMRGHTLVGASVLPEITARLAANDTYRALFTDAFGDDAITADRIGMAIAAFERTLVSRDTSFDRFMAGDDGALDLSQRRGLVAFYDAGCQSCHAGPMFSDFALHHLGLHEASGNDAIRTPSLRQVTHTAPYMHDGSLSTLEDVMAFYGRVDHGIDPDLAPLQPLSTRETTDLIHFLDALSDESIDRTIPTAVPSGLPPGGSVEE